MLSFTDKRIEGVLVVTILGIVSIVTILGIVSIVPILGIVSIVTSNSNDGSESFPY